VPDAGGTGVTGTNNWPNTHLVLQSTGNINLKAQPEAGNTSSSSFYWPGLAYLGTIKANNNGQPEPGTVSDFGTISANGNVNNVLPGSMSKGGGMHFETAQTLNFNSYKVVTNTNSWVNFASDKFTDHYANINANKQVFYGGSKASGNVVDYKLLPKSDFHTQVPNSKK